MLELSFDFAQMRYIDLGKTHDLLSLYAKTFQMQYRPMFAMEVSFLGNALNVPNIQEQA